MKSTTYAASVVTAGYALFFFFTTGVASAADDSHAAIRGTVTSATTGEPLRNAYVRLASASDPMNIRPTVTDAEGRFTFKDVRPSSYTLDAEHQGFVDGKYGDDDDVPVELKVTADQDLTGLNIRLLPPASVSGHVTDEDGDPWTHASVNVFRSIWERGRRQLACFSSAEVDERGEFRAGNLPPGRYYLRAEPDAGWEHTNRAASAPQLQQTWYPNSLDSSAAVPVVLLPGQELTGAGIQLRQGNVYRIRGQVSGLADIPVLPGPKQWAKPRLSVSFLARDTLNNPSGFLKEDGSFEVEDAAPGSYQIRVEAGAVTEIVSLGSVDVHVDDRDVEGVLLTVHAPHPLKGIIRPETDDTPLPAGLVVWLDPLEVGYGKSAPPYADGRFAFDNVSDGKYRVRLQGDPSGQLYLQSVHYGNVESSDGELLISGAEDTIELKLSARGAHISGIVKRRDTARSVTAQVVLVPDTSDVGLKFSETQRGALDQSGAFTVKDAVRPGDYTLYAFQGVPEDVWTNAEFIREIEGKGVKIKVAERDAKTVEVPLIERSDIAALITRLGMN